MYRPLEKKQKINNKEHRGPTSHPLKKSTSPSEERPSKPVITPKDRIKQQIKANIVIKSNKGSPSDFEKIANLKIEKTNMSKQREAYVSQTHQLEGSKVEKLKETSIGTSDTYEGNNIEECVQASTSSSNMLQNGEICLDKASVLGESSSSLVQPDNLSIDDILNQFSETDSTPSSAQVDKQIEKTNEESCAIPLAKLHTSTNAMGPKQIIDTKDLQTIEYSNDLWDNHGHNEPEQHFSTKTINDKAIHETRIVPRQATRQERKELPLSLGSHSTPNQYKVGDAPSDNDTFCNRLVGGHIKHENVKEIDAFRKKVNLKMSQQSSNVGVVEPRVVLKIKLPGDSSHNKGSEQTNHPSDEKHLLFESDYDTEDESESSSSPHKSRKEKKKKKKRKKSKRDRTCKCDKIIDGTCDDLKKCYRITSSTDGNCKNCGRQKLVSPSCDSLIAKDLILSRCRESEYGLKATVPSLPHSADITNDSGDYSSSKFGDFTSARHEGNFVKTKDYWQHKAKMSPRFYRTDSLSSCKSFNSAKENPIFSDTEVQRRISSPHILICNNLQSTMSSPRIPNILSPFQNETSFTNKIVSAITAVQEIGSERGHDMKRASQSLPDISYSDYKDDIEESFVDLLPYKQSQSEEIVRATQCPDTIGGDTIESKSVPIIPCESNAQNSIEDTQCESLNILLLRKDTGKSTTDQNALLPKHLNNLTPRMQSSPEVLEDEIVPNEENYAADKDVMTINNELSLENDQSIELKTDSALHQSRITSLNRSQLSKKQQTLASKKEKEGRDKYKRTKSLEKLSGDGEPRSIYNNFCDNLENDEFYATTKVQSDERSKKISKYNNIFLSKCDYSNLDSKATTLLLSPVSVSVPSQIPTNNNRISPESTFISGRRMLKAIDKTNRYARLAVLNTMKICSKHNTIHSSTSLETSKNSTFERNPYHSSDCMNSETSDDNGPPSKMRKRFDFSHHETPVLEDDDKNVNMNSHRTIDGNLDLGWKLQRDQKGCKLNSGMDVKSSSMKQSTRYDINGSPSTRIHTKECYVKLEKVNVSRFTDERHDNKQCHLFNTSEKNVYTNIETKKTAQFSVEPSFVTEKIFQLGKGKNCTRHLQAPKEETTDNTTGKETDTDGFIRDIGATTKDFLISVYAKECIQDAEGPASNHYPGPCRASSLYNLPTNHAKEVKGNNMLTCHKTSNEITGFDRKIEMNNIRKNKHHVKWITSKDTKENKTTPTAKSSNKNMKDRKENKVPGDGGTRTRNPPKFTQIMSKSDIRSKVSAFLDLL